MLIAILNQDQVMYLLDVLIWQMISSDDAIFYDIIQMLEKLMQNLQYKLQPKDNWVF